MAVKYRRLPRKISRDRERVSLDVYELVLAVYAAGWRGNVNEGHRTMARQWELYRLYTSGRGNLAAYPSDNAPHIRTGRSDHAVDFNDAYGFMARAKKLDVRCSLPVAGESWHVEFNARDLRRFAAKQRARRRKARLLVRLAARRLKRAKARLAAVGA